MDPIIQWIYRAYFHRDEWSVVGLPENVKLASALQMMAHKASTDMHSGYNVLAAHDMITIQMALKFVRKYSTCKDL